LNQIRQVSFNPKCQLHNWKKTFLTSVGQFHCITAEMFQINSYTLADKVIPYTKFTFADTLFNESSSSAKEIKIIHSFQTNHTVYSYQDSGYYHSCLKSLYAFFYYCAFLLVFFSKVICTGMH
jgi:hypothetical protein